MQKPDIGWKTRPRPYSATSSFKSSTTPGVIQPEQSLLRGNSALSTISTSSPPARSLPAQVEPAGPPPMMITSASCIALFQHPLSRPGNLIRPVPGKEHLEKLQRAGAEGGDRAD